MVGWRARIEGRQLGSKYNNGAGKSDDCGKGELV